MSTTAYSQEATTAHYRQLVLQHGATPAATQCSAEGQRFRFDKLLEVGDLAGREVLDMACGIGDLYPLVHAAAPSARYTGVDIVPEMIQLGTQRWPEARFHCRDVLTEGLPGEYDVGFISGLFNNAREDGTRFLEAIIAATFARCREALAFNFISTHVNRVDPEMGYHDPAHVLDFCARHLSRKIRLEHHYERCDVAVFVYR
jgi:SAM-dependent methyltransferase